MTAKQKQLVRNYVKDQYSTVEKVRVKATGQVEAYGPMPHYTNGVAVTNWYFVGWFEDLLNSLPQ